MFKLLVMADDYNNHQNPHGHWSAADPASHRAGNLTASGGAVKILG